MAVTDHNMTKGWKRALAAGRKHGINVIRGEELKAWHDGRKIGEVLALFINEEIRPGEVPEIMDAVRAQGGILVVAHPFDVLRNNFRMLDEYRKCFDGMEAFNARVVFNGFNTKARRYARAHGIGMTGGSDSHCRFEIGNGYTVADITEPRELMDAIRKRDTTATGRKTNPLIHTLSSMAKIGLLKTPKY